MKFWIRIILVMGSLAILMDCGAQSPKRSAPQQVLTEENFSTDRLQFESTPELDVLFVVDNSISMRHHQVKLAQNINEFVKAFTSNAAIDFHIGVIAIYDSDVNHRDAVEAKHPLGHLIPLQDPNPNAAPGTPYMVNGKLQNFVSNDPKSSGFVDPASIVPVLSKTLLLGEDPGPQYEEMFSPVEAFFTPALLNGVNKGFYRPEAHLLIVWITDANDSTIGISAESMFRFLVDLKGGRRDLLHLYAIISPVNELCPKDQAGPPYKFNLLAAHSDGTILSLCSPTYGIELAKFSQTLKAQVGEQTIQLGRHPDAKNSTIKVTFGSQEIPLATAPNYDEGWSYDPDPNVEQIKIGGNLKLKPEAGAKINIDFLPVDFKDIRSDSASSSAVQSPSAQEAQNQPTIQGKEVKN